MRFRKKGQDNNLCQNTGLKVFSQVEVPNFKEYLWGCRQNCLSYSDRNEYWSVPIKQYGNLEVVKSQRARTTPDFIYFLTEKDVKAYIGPKAKRVGL